jgi:hypothetical protein
VRTPIGRYAGALSGIRPDDLAAHVVRSLVARSSELDPARIDDVFFGDANGAGEDNRDVAHGVAARRFADVGSRLHCQPTVRLRHGSGDRGESRHRDW